MDKYRVIVLREGTEKDETLFEVAGPAMTVARIAPGALLDALDEDAQQRAGRETAPAPERSLADRVFDGAVAAGDAAEQQGSGGPAGETAEQATKRKRRTKAEIAADKEAQGLGFRDAAHRAEVESQQAGQPTADAPPIPAAPPVEQAFPGAVATPHVEQAAAVSAPTGTPAPQYNPFQQ